MQYSQKDVSDAISILKSVVNIDVDSFIDDSDNLSAEEKLKVKSEIDSPVLKGMIKNNASESELKDYIKSRG